ncbi:MAG TPA: hypothetical protein VFT12_10055 [Thermoanaerobaculia bacterium]|nr:hypothetical protein [Thermoanaerobaculia bacterium]
MKRVVAALILAGGLTACGGEKPAESTYGSTDTIPTRTDTTQTSTAGPGAQPSLETTDTTNTQYGGTTVTDTSQP